MSTANANFCASSVGNAWLARSFHGCNCDLAVSVLQVGVQLTTVNGSDNSFPLWPVMLVASNFHVPTRNNLWGPPANGTPVSVPRPT